MRSEGFEDCQNSLERGGHPKASPLSFSVMPSAQSPEIIVSSYCLPPVPEEDTYSDHKGPEEKSEFTAPHEVDNRYGASGSDIEGPRSFPRFK
jgi:hypothetical protein